MNESLINFILLVCLILIEVVAMSTINYSAIHKNNYYIIGLFFYLFVGYILYVLLVRHSSLAVVNSKWNMVSILLITAISILYFKEKITSMEMMGVALAIVATFCMEYEELKNLIYK